MLGCWKLAADEKAFPESGSGWEKWAGVRQVAAAPLSSEETDRQTDAKGWYSRVRRPGVSLHLPLNQPWADHLAALGLSFVT